VELLLPEQRTRPNRDIWKPDSSSGFWLQANREINYRKSILEKISGLELFLDQKLRERRSGEISAGLQLRAIQLPNRKLIIPRVSPQQIRLAIAVTQASHEPSM